MSAATPRRGWLRRNALALGALILLLPGSAVVIGGQEWISYYGYRPISAVAVAAGESVAFAGAEFGPVTLDDATSEFRDQVPPGIRSSRRRA